MLFFLLLFSQEKKIISSFALVFSYFSKNYMTSLGLCLMVEKNAALLVLATISVHEILL